tara:strand:- start:10927 stop:11850 length:924 start_codon:yes stop_codon:yes gene_type:complete
MKILVLGSKGMVGSSVVRKLNVIDEYQIIESSRKDTNLFSIKETQSLFNKIRPNVIVNAAAKVGGIMANDTQRTEFILNNLKINMNIIESLIGLPNIRLINLGSSCIYPLGAKMPIKESALMTGPLEPTNSPYAMAKLAAIEMGDAISKEYGNNVINLMPTNLYGPHDNFSENDSHVIPGLIFRMHQAKENNSEFFSVWGSGNPLREFLHVNDLAESISFIISNDIRDGLYNIGSGAEISIKELVHKIKKVVDFQGDILFDATKPDGNPRKLLDSSKINELGWTASIDLDTGLKDAYRWFLKSIGLD